jgi:hypothetical protein
MPLLDDDTAITTLLRTARSIAVVGLSNKPHRDSFIVARYLLERGYTVYPVNPAIRTVFDIPSYPDLASIGRPVDIVDVFRQPDFVPAVVREAIAAGATTIWFQLGVAHPRATADALHHGLRVVEERCIMVEHRRLLR